MILFKNSNQLERYCKQIATSGKYLGFVPTMGALHNGHVSLLETSKQNNDITVCSIFVNPTQFNDPADFRKYPITIEADIVLLEQAGTEILFLPDVHEIYPDGITQMSMYDLGHLEKIFEGKYRPGHFQGVSQVMNRLLNIIQPHQIYMGQKDYQQCMVINRLLQIMHSKAILNTCPTVREPDGLAMSSRNARLNTTERSKATCIYQSLMYIRDRLQPGNVDDILNSARAFLGENQFVPDYVSLADAKTLEEITWWNGKQQVIALIAAFMNEVRLIDNMLLNGRAHEPVS